MGYASGSFDYANERYVVRETDSHAWVEVYFPGIGWVEFEPTAAQPAIVRPDGDGMPVVLPAVELPEPEIQPTFNLAARLKSIFPLALLSLACLGALAVQGALIWRVVERWRWSRLLPGEAVIALYGHMRRRGERLLQPLPHGDTPDEFANRLQSWLTTTGQTARPASIRHRLSSGDDEIDQLTQCYTQAVYSAHPVSREMQATAWQTWRKLRQRLWLAGVVKYLRRKSKSPRR
jgi:hypothetical protein